LILGQGGSSQCKRENEDKQSADFHDGSPMVCYGVFDSALNRGRMQAIPPGEPENAQAPAV
jgi:hypothetical protein